jgi:hypothetical protein
MLNKVVRPREIADDAFMGAWQGTGVEIYRRVSDKDAVKKIAFKVKMIIAKMAEGQYRIESQYSFAKNTKIRGTLYDKDEQSSEHDYDAIIGDENNLKALSSYTDADLSNQILERFMLNEQDKNLLHHTYTGHANDIVFPKSLPGLLSRLVNEFRPEKMLVTGIYSLQRTPEPEESG